MKRKRLLIFAAGVLSLTTIGGIGVYAQTLAGTGAAIGAGATLGAASGAGLLTPGQYAAPATGAAAGAGGAMMDAAGDPTGAGGAGASTVGGASVTVRTVTTTPPLKWGPDSGDDMVRQLTSVRKKPAARQTTRRSATRARNVARMTPKQRSKMVNAKYKKPPVGYLAWYLPEDRYKLTSRVWQFVTTPNDRFYYHPSAPAMKLRHPARVIGFHTWQDAMIAGYRPDPATKPAPGPQLAHLASLTRGPMLSRYFEYVYAGQVTPEAFAANYKYTRYVADLVASKSHTRHLVDETVDQVIGASLGLNPTPRYVGTMPPAATTMQGEGLPPMPVPDAPMAAEPGMPPTP